MIQFKNKNVTVFQSALFQTNSTVIETNDLILLVDPTWLPHEIQEIQQYVATIREGKKLYLLFTHGDFDHIIGYEAFPDAIVIGSKGLHEHPNKEKKLQLIQEFDNEYYIERTYPISFPQVDIIIEEDGQTLIIGETVLTFYFAQGHTQDGVFALVEPHGIWIAGDYLSDFELPFIYHSVKEYEKTLQKASGLVDTIEFSLLVPGHGKVTQSIAEMKRRIAASDDYLQRLKNAVVSNDTEAVQKLETELAFPSNFTRECHETNITITEKEYGSKEN
ncbi:MBL fold metallo-hydrolase [Bacillus sp. 165]|uniref:MBL fold metallo-hydrolase n=1 Tax=Bacillus sp. 165 TaxID=1529117 RepID=UPI001AD9A1D2|nr:MBL fold metallo-hydrolase [Bacillus sp. 165]MBO9128423.1 MBL fold metallo-hydrolase [Bacillus sp. 165]